MLISFFVLAAASAGQASAPAVRQVPVVRSEAMTQAMANQKLMRQRPYVRKDREPAYPDSEKKAGNGGQVLLRGIIGLDGKLSEVAVVRSSAGPVLTNAALAAAQAVIFYPAKDKSGTPITVPVQMPFNFSTSSISDDVITRIDAPHSEAARTAGMHGTVTVGGKIGGDGKLLDAKILSSSRSPELDAAALSAATQTIYRSFKAGDGTLIEQPVQRVFAFFSYDPSRSGTIKQAGLTKYSCRQFAKDQAWWLATWGNIEYGDLYRKAQALNFMDGGQLEAHLVDFKARWLSSIDVCREKPDALFIDTLKPEGAALGVLLGSG